MGKKGHRSEREKWLETRTGNPYILHVKNRTMEHSFRVQAYGHTIKEAIKRFFTCKEIRNAVKVVAVYECTCEQSCEEGERLI